MPELPEVETIKNQLLRKTKGRTIKKVGIIDYQKRFQGDPKKILGRILDIRRRAKLIVFNLAKGNSFLIHLKLTGQLVYYPKRPKETPKFAKVVFTFQDGSKLFFNDFRKFGFVKVMKTSEVGDYLKKENYGPEPLELSLKQFQALLKKKPKAKIKPLLMDQTFIAGLGNIYAQEACFKAKIYPERKVSTLTAPEIKKLYSAIIITLRSAIKHQGTSFDTSYRTLENQPGGFEPYIQVYHRKSCPRCKNHLKILKLGGRSTYYCPKCQR